jgi:hypothetical protein
VVENFTCPECGNARSFLAEHCPYCGTAAAPVDGPEYVVFNLESGGPTVEEALRTVDRVLERAFESGVRGLIVIHGHGSSGAGGAIRRAFREGLESNFWAHQVAEHVAGESLRHGTPEYSRLVERRPALRQALRREMPGNPGITVLLLAKS